MFTKAPPRNSLRKSAKHSPPLNLSFRWSSQGRGLRLVADAAWREGRGGWRDEGRGEKELVKLLIAEHRERDGRERTVSERERERMRL